MTGVRDVVSAAGQEKEQGGTQPPSRPAVRWPAPAAFLEKRRPEGANGHKIYGGRHGLSGAALPDAGGRAVDTGCGHDEDLRAAAPALENLGDVLGRILGQPSAVLPP
jgi:hypothetical protein